MSGALKSIGKVFKKVVKVVKKIAPYALMAAAVVFTGGAALGVLPTFSTAVGGLVSSLGVGSALAPILTGAITNAGFGAAIGGVLGGKKGMTTGLLMGAAAGGIGGALAAGGAGAGAAGAAAAPSAAGTSLSSFVANPIAATGAMSAAPAAFAPVVAAAPAASGLTGLLGNPTIAAQLLQGLGTGITNSAQVKAERKAAEEASQNYSTAGGLLDPAVLGGQQPANDASVDPYAQTGAWTYDPRAGKIVRRQ